MEGHSIHGRSLEGGGKVSVEHDRYVDLSDRRQY